MRNNISPSKQLEYAHIGLDSINGETEVGGITLGRKLNET